MKTILITGASGFIAKSLAKVLKENQHKIIGISRNAQVIEDFDQVYYGFLGEPLVNVFQNEKIDAMVHCANFIGNDDYNINLTGTKLWAQQAQENNVQMQIFLSSVSACADAVSSYGKSKYEIEKWFVTNNQIVLRLGLVIGNGGLFGEMISMVKKLPVLPLLDNGKTLTYFTGIATLTNIVKDTIEMGKIDKRGVVWNIQQSTPLKLKTVMVKIKRQLNRCCIFMPIPSKLILPVLIINEKLNLKKLSITSNNIRGLKQNDKEIKSDLEKLGYPELRFDDLIRDIR